MRICILCENEKIAEARERAKTITSENALSIPLSKSGEEPATHWFCSMEVTEAGYEKILELQKNTEVEIASPFDFLKKKKLQIIKTKK
jgi:hypothetical protein